MKQVTIETGLILLAFAGIVYAVFASSFVVGIAATTSFVYMLVTSLRRA